MARRKISTLTRDVRIQWKVIHALVIRELHTRYGRENIGFLWVLGEPLLFCGGVAIAWTWIRPSHEHGLAMTAMVVTGYIPLTMWRHCVGRAVKAYEANGSLFFHRQVTPLDVLIARSWLEIIGTIMAGLVVVVLAIFLGYMAPPVEWGILYLGVFLQILFCLATALIFASLSEMSDVVEKGLSTFSYLALPLTGAFIMVDWVPPKYRVYMMASPSWENIEMIRAGEFGEVAHAHYNLTYAIWIEIILMIIGIALSLRARKYILIQ